MFRIHFNPIIVLFLTAANVTNDRNNVIFQSYYSLISNGMNSANTMKLVTDFNPIIVLFLTLYIKSVSQSLSEFQSYYSLISNGCFVDKSSTLNGFQSYYSLISNY